jgi:hypothetical protein
MQDLNRNSFHPKDLKIVSRTPTRNKDTQLTRPKLTDLQSLNNFTGNIYKIRSVPLLPDSKYVARTCPKKILTDKERLYEENLNLKQMYNYINEENLKMRTKIQLLEKNAESRSQEVNSSSNKSYSLVDSLKNAIKDLRSEARAKDKEIEDMKRYIRYTKMQELEAEVLQLQSECTRLKLIIDDIIKQRELLPDGLEAYNNLKNELKSVKNQLKQKDLREEQQSLRIEELEKKNDFQENYEKFDELVERLQQDLSEKNQKIQELQEKNRILNEKLKNLPEKKGKNTQTSLDSSKPPVLFTKIQDFLTSHHISSAAWVKSITKNDFLIFQEFTSAVIQDLPESNDQEIQVFWKKYSKDGKMSSQVLISLYSDEEIEKLSISEIFETFKAQATLAGVSDLQDYLENELPGPELSEVDLFQLCSKPVFHLESSQNIQVFFKHLQPSSIPVSREEVIEKVLKNFSLWVPLRKSEIEGILKRFQILLFDVHEDLTSRIQEKSRFQSIISMEDLMKELAAYGIIDSESEISCARALIFFISRSVKRVAYLKVISFLSELTEQNQFVRDLKEDLQLDHNENSLLGDSLHKDNSEEVNSEEEVNYEEEDTENKENDEVDLENSQEIKSHKQQVFKVKTSELEEVMLSEGFRHQEKQEKSHRLQDKSSSSSSKSSDQLENPEKEEY